MEFKSVEEVLGLDEVRDPAGAEESYDAKALIEDLKSSDFMLKSINRRLDDYVKEYEKDPSKRDDIELAYTFKIDVLGNLAKAFMPLSKYGKKQIREIRKCSREYESFVGPLITVINAENAEAFSKVLTADMQKDVEVGKLHALGAIRTEDGSRYAVGAICYTVEHSPFLDAEIGRIFWLYVHEDFRGRGIGDHLVAELVGGMLENGVEYITIDSGLGDEDDIIKGYIMGSWKFKTETGINPDTMIRIKDITNYSKINEKAKGVNPVASLDGGIGSNGVKNALKGLGRPIYLSDQILKGGYIDDDLSFYIGTETSISALLLAHRMPSGMVRVEYLRSESGSFDEQEKLLNAFIKKAVSDFSDETVLYIPTGSVQEAAVLEKICPIQMGQYLLEGLMSPPTSDLDITPEEVKELLELSADDIDVLLQD